MTIVESSIRPNEMKVDGSGVEAFRRRLSGAWFARRARLRAARAVWNGMIDRRPALIAYCANSQDVIEAVDFARTTGILTAVRSGGHNIAGASLCDGGLVIDLSRMNRVTVDPKAAQPAQKEARCSPISMQRRRSHGLGDDHGREQRHRTDRPNARRRHRSARPQARAELRQHVVGRDRHRGWAGAERL